jgi:hypothetical protein
MDRNEVRHALTGPVPSLGTPLCPDGTIDCDGLRTAIDCLIDAGARTLILTHGDSLYTLLKLEGSFDAGIHGLSEIVGNHGRWRRRPYHSLTDAQMEDLRSVVQSLGVL